MNRWEVVIAAVAITVIVALTAGAVVERADGAEPGKRVVHGFAAKPGVDGQLGGGQHPGIDHRPCVTLPESSRFPLTKGKAVLEEFIDTKGWVVERTVEEVIKHYPFCDHPSGWLAVSYVPGHPGWRVYKSALVFNCWTQQAGGPKVPCEPSEPSVFDFFVERREG